MISICKFISKYIFKDYKEELRDYIKHENEDVYKKSDRNEVEYIPSNKQKYKDDDFKINFGNEE